MIARVIARTLTIVVLVASSVYVLVYLYRWEWNRALIAGVFMLASQLALIASIIMRRLQSIEHRLDGLVAIRQPSEPALLPDPEAPAAVADPEVVERVREAAPDHRPFAWLDPTKGGTNVFVPVLMGAGALLSLVAWAVEKVAGFGATPALERGLARRLGVLALPDGPLASPEPVPLSIRVPKPSLRSVGAKAGIAVLAVGGLWWGIDGLADLTQDRPSAYPADQATVVELSYSYRKGGVPERTTQELWAACRTVLPTNIRAVELAATGGGGRMILNPGLGEHAVRRFRGCLNDANIAKTIASVSSLHHAPWPPQG